MVTEVLIKAMVVTGIKNHSRQCRRRLAAIEEIIQGEYLKLKATIKNQNKDKDLMRKLEKTTN